MNSAPAAMAALVAPGLGAANVAGASAPSPLDEGAGGAGLGFAGLLLPEADLASPDVGDTLATTETAAIAPPAPAPTPLPAPLPPTTATPPPPMSDPATTAVLNALALRVATESNTATGIVGGAATGTLSTAQVGQGAPAGLGLALQALGSAIAQVTGRTAGGPAASQPAATASVASALPLKTVTGDVVAVDLQLEALVADLAPVQADGEAVAAPGTAAPGSNFLGASSPALTPLASLAAPLAAVANVVAAMATPLPVTGENELALLAGVQGAAGVDASALVAAASGTSQPASPPAASPLQPAAFQAFLRADGSLPQIAVPMDSPQWGNELSTRVVAMAREQFTEAEIRVTPDELGPIEVKLRFDGDRVHAQFGAISPEAREALTANLHRLREMLAGDGLNLGQTFVGHHGADRPSGQSTSAGRGGFGQDADGDELATASITTRAASVRVGLLDEFA
jgi:flagellar hook-length control protein FliK